MIVAELNDELADKDRQQAIFSLLGEGFVLKNFPHHKYVQRASLSISEQNYWPSSGVIRIGSPG